MDHPVTSTRSSDGIENSLADTREPGRELVTSERVWSGPIFAVDADQVRLGPGQEPVARQVVIHHDAVAVVALREGEVSSQADGAAEILMVRQYRHPVRASLWEIPAGLLDVPGEAPAVAAARELAEETDYVAATWNTLAEFYASHRRGEHVVPGDEPAECFTTASSDSGDTINYADACSDDADNE